MKSSTCWLNRAIQIATEEALKSPMLNIHGAVLINPRTHKIISRGHNTNAKCRRGCKRWNCFSSHAEEMAMRGIPPHILKGFNPGGSACA